MPGIFRSTSRIDQRSSSMASRPSGPSGGRPDRVAVLLEPARQRLADDLLVVDDQDAGVLLLMESPISSALLEVPGPAVAAEVRRSSRRRRAGSTERAITQRAVGSAGARRCGRARGRFVLRRTAEPRRTRPGGTRRPAQARRRDDGRRPPSCASPKTKVRIGMKRSTSVMPRMRAAVPRPPRREPLEDPVRGVLAAARRRTRRRAARPRARAGAGAPNTRSTCVRTRARSPPSAVARRRSTTGRLSLHVVRAPPARRRRAGRRAGAGSSPSCPGRPGSPPPSCRRAARRCRRRPTGRAPCPSPWS